MDYIAGFLEIFALYVIGCKNRIGFAINICSGIAWITYVITHHVSYGLLIVVIPAMIINGRNYFKWAEHSN